VDNDRRNAESRLLKSAQYRVIIFELTEQFRQSDFKSSTGCLLRDIRLPVIGGIELQEPLLASGTQIP